MKGLCVQETFIVVLTMLIRTDGQKHFVYCRNFFALLAENILTMDIIMCKTADKFVTHSSQLLLD